MGAGRMSVGAMPETLERLIVALCADYMRRKRAVAERSVGIRTEMEYKYVNHRILEGAAEIVGAELAELYIDEIGRRVGYVNSAHPASCESSYKTEKGEVKLSIARKLHLL